MDPRVGGRIYLSWNSGDYAAGHFSEVVKNEQLAFTWRGRDDSHFSELVVQIMGNGDGTTTVQVSQSAAHADGAWAEAATKMWEEALEDLQSALETGKDLRTVRRPMFGLSGAEELNEELAKRLRVPVNEGLRLSGLVDGMGALNAGLQKDDVVVRLGGYPVSDFPTLADALQRHKAGDTIDVEFYRDGELHTRSMTLSERPSADLPESAKALAENLRATHAALDAELDGLFEGLSEEQADWRPSPEEWNSKETLAHLIAAERDVQTWITAFVQDNEFDSGFANEVARLRALVSVYPTIPEIVATLKTAEAETLALLLTVPAHGPGYKRMLKQLADWAADSSYGAHHREHFALIKEMLEAAGQ